MLVQDGSNRFFRRETLNNPRMLVASRKETAKAKRASESLKFRKMVEALSIGGFHAKHVMLSSFRDYHKNLATIEPDMAFCSFFVSWAMPTAWRICMTRLSTAEWRGLDRIAAEHE